MNRGQARALLPAYQKLTTVHYKSDGTNPQLVHLILKQFPLAVNQTRQLAARFKGSTDEQTARNVWQFLKSEVRYIADGFFTQKIKLPPALLAVGTGDCKSYALFTAGILKNLGFDVTFRFTGYYGANYPGHVYVVASRGGKKFIIDAVWKGAFNTEKKYSYLKDYPMRIETITGVGCADCGPHDIGKTVFGKAIDKLGSKAKEAVKDAGQALKKAAEKGIPAVVKVAGAAPRNVFLGLVKINVHGYATKLARANAAKVAEIWTKLGGDVATLRKIVAEGAGKKPILGVMEEYAITGHCSSGIGDPATIAAAIAAAAPILIAFAEIFRENRDAKKGESPGEQPTGEGEKPQGSGLPDAVKNALDLAKTVLQTRSGSESPTPSAPGAPYTPPSSSGGGSEYSSSSSQGSSTQNIAPTTEGKTPGWLLPAAGLALLWALK